MFHETQMAAAINFSVLTYYGLLHALQTTEKCNSVSSHYTAAKTGKCSITYKISAPSSVASLKTIYCCMSDLEHYFFFVMLI